MNVYFCGDLMTEVWLCIVLKEQCMAGYVYIYVQ